MNIVIITNSDMYEDRAELIRSRLATRHSVTVISTDFLHIKKKKRASGREHFIHLPTKPYKKNISVGRMLSHRKFAKAAIKEAEKHSPDLMWIMLPANSNADFAVKYKRKHNSVRLVFDIIDMWPESFPLKKYASLPPFAMWRNLRDKSLKYADYVVSECDLYREMLAEKLGNIPNGTLYLAKNPVNTEKLPSLPDNGICLCYLGSVNNIIDIPLIARFVAALSALTTVTVEIIGSGERMDEFVSAVESAGGRVVLHGAVYDPAEKQKIFDTCHFGINVMRPTVCVGLTMKSMDYLEGGLPLVNNIKCDTARFVDNFGAGVNISESDEDLTRKAELIAGLSKEELLSMREGAEKVFRDHLTTEVFVRTLEGICKSLGV